MERDVERLIRVEIAAVEREYVRAESELGSAGRVEDDDVQISALACLV
jgi:hypothetical protein